MVKLSKIITQVRGVSYKPNDVILEKKAGYTCLLRANNIDRGELKFDDVVYVDSARVKNTQLLRAEDILICASSGSRHLVGKAACVIGDMNVTFGAFCKVIRPLAEYAPFLGWFFKSPRYRMQISNASAGVNINNIRAEDIDNMEIDLLTVKQREEAVRKLNAITHLISLRQRQAEKLDELVKARFVEMFGDPVLNTRHLPSVSGTSLFKLSNGKAVPVEKRFDSGIPAYGGNGISWYTDEALINTDTLVVGRVGFQSGNVHFVYGPLWITDNAMYVTWYRKELICLRFLNQLMKRVDFSRYQDAGDLKKITQKPFMKFKYILPSMNLQMEFVNFMDSVNCEKERIQRNAALLATLKRSLMQQYFG